MNKHDKEKLYKKLFIGTTIVCVILAVICGVVLGNGGNLAAPFVITIIVGALAILFMWLWLRNTETIDEKIKRVHEEKFNKNKAIHIENEKILKPIVEELQNYVPNLDNLHLNDYLDSLNKTIICNDSDKVKIQRIGIYDENNHYGYIFSHNDWHDIRVELCSHLDEYCEYCYIRIWLYYHGYEFYGKYGDKSREADVCDHFDFDTSLIEQAKDFYKTVKIIFELKKLEKQNTKSKITKTILPHTNNTTITVSRKQPIFDETIDKCTRLDEIIRIDYKGEAVPENASVVTLKNNHSFTSEDFLDIYGYQTKKTAKLQYFFFLDKSRIAKDENGNNVYPAIKLTAKTIANVPDLTTEEAKKFIAISYAERATKNYAVPAEEIDDLSHYRWGKYLYEEQQKIIKNDYCVIDIETTGLSRATDQIIEISALRVRNNEIADTFIQLVKPTISIPTSATEINGITNEMVKNASKIKEVLLSFLEFVGDDIVIGHNIERFDLEFINRDCNNELSKSFDNDYIDTYPLARQTFHNVYNYKLSTLCMELGITQSKHRAEADCISTKELYDKIKEHRLLTKQV